jgi:hypothetical protein
VQPASQPQCSLGNFSQQNARATVD